MLDTTIAGSLPKPAWLATPKTLWAPWRLGGEWRQYELTFPLLARSRIGGISLECANSRVPMALIGLLGAKDVLVGAIDVASNRVETPGEVAAVIREAMRHVAPERI